MRTFSVQVNCNRALFFNSQIRKKNAFRCSTLRSQCLGKVLSNICSLPPGIHVLLALIPSKFFFTNLIRAISYKRTLNVKHKICIFSNLPIRWVNVRPQRLRLRFSNQYFFHYSQSFAQKKRKILNVARKKVWLQGKSTPEWWVRQCCKCVAIKYTFGCPFNWRRWYFELLFIH